VLTDKQKRKEYDMLGDDYGKTGPSGGGGGYSQGRSPGAGPQFQEFYHTGSSNSGGFTFKRSSHGGFEDMFGAGGPFTGGFPSSGGSQSFSFGDGRGDGGFGNIFQDMMGQFFGGGSGSSSYQQNQHSYTAKREQAAYRRGTGGNSRQKQQQQQRSSASSSSYTAAEPLIMKINVTLEEVFTGKTKKLRVKDTILIPPGKQPQPIEKTFEVTIPTGAKQGTLLKFPASPDFPKPVHFELQETKHRYFERDGYNLLWKCELTKRQITKGVKINVPLLDGKTLTINSQDYTIRHGTTIPFEQHGLPYQHNKQKKGDLIIKFIIKTEEEQGKSGL
jgi:DnaJ-class molecular chaperone